MPERGNTVLVVDDSAGVRHVITHLLEPEGLHIVGVADGEAALQEARNLPGLVLIFCDVTMPVMSGMELLAKLKAEPATAAVPVLMMTALDDPSTIAQARATGAVGWIIKPFAKGHIVAAARKVLSKIKAP